MGGFNKTPYLVTFIILGTIGVGTAFALITITLSGDVVITGFLDMTGDKITNVGVPTIPTDAATKGYVDSAPGTDTLASLGCNDTELAQLIGSVWTCVSLTVKNNPITIIDDLSGEEESGGTHLTTAIGADNNPVISYNDDRTEDLKVVHCGNPSCTSGNTVTTVDSTGEVGGSAILAIGVDGLPVISYEDTTKFDIKVVHCGNASCSSGNTFVVVDNTTDTGNSKIAMAIGTDNNPVIGYRAQGSGLKLVHCGDPDCAENTNSNTVTILDGPGDVGDPSIAIGTDNFPVISYSDESPNFDLKVVHCTNVSCTTFDNTTTVDSTGNVGRGGSITIGVDGLPVISYKDQTNDFLKVVHCGNLSCSSGNTISVINGTGDVSSQTSITIGVDGLPVIVYEDDGDFRRAKMVHCGNSFCSSINSIITIDNVSSDYASIAIGTDNNPVIGYFDNSNEVVKVAILGPVVILE